jgi:AcrR family transcriptional regulator
MHKKSDTARRGRPRDPKRINKVIETAANQFLEYGFERTSMDAIAQASGVSKVTIYRYFPSKEALFEAVVGQRTDEVFDGLAPSGLDPADPKTALTRIGGRFLELKRSDPVIGIFRALYAAAGQQDSACRAFYRQGPDKLIRQVAAFLEAADAAGSLSVANPETAADQFLSLFLGAAHIKAMLGLGKPGKKRDQQLVADNVQLFLKAYSAKRTGR